MIKNDNVFNLLTELIINVYVKTGRTYKKKRELRNLNNYKGNTEREF